MTSPRKAALLRKTPKKKKSKSPGVSIKSPIPSIKSPVMSVMSILTPNIDDIKQKKPEKEEEGEKLQVDIIEEEPPDTSDLNRSDSVQEVAALLTHLPETILAKTNSKNLDDKNMIEANILLETPLKMDCSMSPLPNTPRFAVPIVITSTQETPIPKAVKTVTTIAAISSIVKHCDILTPSFPLTPGFKDITPLKSDQSPTSLSASGYSSRRTDYSSCSSYYKPDESEEVTRNIDSIIKKARNRNSQSESDNGAMITIEEEHSIKIRVGSAKKVEVPGAMERVNSFAEDITKEITIPHYTMMEEGLLSESIVTTASDSDSSSSFTCSTCSTDPSTDDNATMEFLNQSEIPEDDAPDSEWHCEKVDEVAESNNSLVDEKTGELRFPLRNLMTPRKVEEEIKTIIEETAIVETKESEEEVKNRFATNLEAVKQRTLRIIKSESAGGASKKNQTKFKRSNAKAFKVPAEQPRQIPQSRREQILSQNLSNRSRPTPLKLIASAATSSLSLSSSSSSSRRKNATPRKTIVIDDLPKAASPLKKQRKIKKKSESPMKPSPVNLERLSLENISDNAVMPDEHPSLNISSSFNDGNNSEHENTSITVIQNVPLEVRKDDEGSNTFQKAMIEQGFNKKDVEELEKKLVEEKPEEEKKEEGQITDSDDDDEEEESDDCVLVLSDVLDKNVFKFQESTSKRVKKSYDPLTKFPPSKCKIDENVIKLGFSEIMDLFSMAPAKPRKESEKNNNSKRREREERAKTSSKTRSSGMREENSTE